MTEAASVSGPTASGCSGPGGSGSGYSGLWSAAAVQYRPTAGDHEAAADAAAGPGGGAIADGGAAEGGVRWQSRIRGSLRWRYEGWDVRVGGRAE